MPRFVSNSKLLTIRELSSEVGSQASDPAKSYGLILRSERVACKALQGNSNFEPGAYRRANRPFVAINSVGQSKELLESDLFGHEQGEFIGAGIFNSHLLTF
jgi:hypothetical protein